MNVTPKSTYVGKAIIAHKPEIRLHWDTYFYLF